MTLRVITGPATEPVTLTAAKAYLRVDGTDDDTLITSLIKSARLKAEELSRRALITQTLEMVIECWPASMLLPLLQPPLLTVVSVKYVDYFNVEHTWTDYVVDIRSEPGQIIFNTFPGDALQESGPISVRYTAGYGAADTAVPENFKAGILALVAYWYENREGNDVPVAIRNAFMAERVVWF